MKIGFATMVGVTPMPFEDVVRFAGDHKFQCLEVNVGPVFRPAPGSTVPGHLDLQQIVAEGPDQVHALLNRHNVEISALAPMMNLLDRDPAVRKERIAYFRLTIDACAALGVPVAVTYGGSAYGMYFYGLPAVGPGHSSNHVEDNLILFADVFAPLAEYASARGVKIALETAPRGGGAGNIAHNPALWDRLFEQVPNPALGLAFDPSHLVWLRTEPPESLIREFSTRIHHVDGKDCEIKPEALARQGVLGNDWWRYRIPGMGSLNWAAIISALKEVGYDHAIDFEHEDPIYGGLEGLVMSRNHLAQYLPEVEA